MKKLFIAALLLVAASVANAQTYVGVGALHMTDDTVSLTSLALTYDYKPNANFGFQVGLATGGDDQVDLPPTGTRVDVELDYALFAKAKLGLTAGNAFWYGTAGYSNFNLEAEVMSFNVDQDGNGTLFGAGVDFAITQTFGFGLEYSRGFSDLEDTDMYQAVLHYRF